MTYTTDHTTAPTSGARDVDIVRHRYTEAKDGFKTSEFYVMAAFVAAVLFATYLDADSLAREDGWRFAAFAVVAYIISRGLAKLGVRHPSDNE
jgi:predicted cobalt transporter CbtA